MCRYDHDYRLLINAGLSHNEAKSIAEQTHFDRLKAESEARRNGDTVRVNAMKLAASSAYGKLGGVAAKGLLY